MPETTPPNVLVFFTDQQRWDASGLHGNPLDLMPNFDRLCASGVHLAKTFTCQPVCGPARSCLQTGLYATQTGSYRNGIALDTSLRTLAHHFGDAGYATGYIGKWHLGSRSLGRGPVPVEERGGYDYWLAADSLEHTSDAYHTVLYDGDCQPVRLPGYRVDALTDAAIRYMTQPRDNPFYLFLSFLEPHHQNFRDDYPAPDGYAERYLDGWTPPDLAALGGTAPQHLPGYWGMIKRLDEALGRVVDALKSTGQLENTLILFTSDHACHFKTRNSEYKRSCHDSSLRVPTMLHGPGLPGGRTLESLVSLVDLPPTLLDAAGLEVPAAMAGRSLLPDVRGQRPAPEEDFVVAQISEDIHGRTIRTQRWKYAVTAPWCNAPQPERYREAFLYDLQADPYELENLIDIEAFRPVADDLRAKLVAKLRSIGEPDVPIDPVETRLGGQRRIKMDFDA